jgi:hypothetical protein
MDFKYNGAKALVELHEKHIKQFVSVWRKGKEAGIVLPVTDDPDYKSMETLLFHVLGAGRRYMVWICDKLNLPDPGIIPPPENIVPEMDAYMNHLIEKWKSPLADLRKTIFMVRHINQTGERNIVLTQCLNML